jgi:hypothetical protein
MRTRSYFNYSDQDLMCRLKVLVANERSATAELVACIAEVEKRGLFRPAGYDSMHAYCLHELHLSDDAAFKRIRAARAALDYPAILDALADGRLHLTAVVLLAKHLRPENAAELLEAAEFNHLRDQDADRRALPAGGSAGPNRGGAERASFILPNFTGFETS